LKTKTLLNYIVQEDEAGLRLDKYLSTLEEISSRSFAQDLIEKKLVFVNQKNVKSSFSLSLGQQIDIHLPEVVPSELVPYDFKLEIIFEDDDLIVINKPSGLVVHPAAGHQQDTLVNALLHHTKNLSMKHEQRPGIVHRIDKDTSGLLVVAKNDKAHENLAQQFKDKTTHRVYYALASGQVPRINGICQSYLARHPYDRKRYASVRENNKVITTFDEDFSYGKWAITHYSKILMAKGYSYLKIKLETGRTHQIRVHMCELGHPLVGDTMYGFSQKELKHLQINRFFLHAAELGFAHPRTGEEKLFQVKWPVPDQKFLNSLGFQHESISK
jgi:23S rRNA pseudouridine1911/1915/1917 synthase